MTETLEQARRRIIQELWVNGDIAWDGRPVVEAKLSEYAALCVTERERQIAEGVKGLKRWTSGDEDLAPDPHGDWVWFDDVLALVRKAGQ